MELSKMSNYFMASVDTIPSGEISVEVEEGQFEVVWYEGKCENRPINMNRVTSFEKDSHKYTTTKNLSIPVEYPIIRFRNEDQKDIIWWHYPPTDEGRAARDNDYEFMKKELCIRCEAVTENPYAE